MAASKKVASKLESDIEKYRSECNWEKLKEVVLHRKTKTQGIEILSHLVSGECRLEEYLLKNPPTSINPDNARKHLEAAKDHFNQVLKAGSKNSYYKDALLLLAKLHFALGETEEALKLLDKVKLEDISQQDLPCTKLKLLAEGYAIRGMVMEKQLSSQTEGTKDKVTEDDVIAMFERAGDLAMYYLQEADKIRYGSAGTITTYTTSGHPSSHLAGPVLETAVQRAPLLHIQHSNLDKGINRFRQILKAVEVRTTQNIRTTIARELAEVLLRAVCQHAYTPPTLENRDEKPESNQRRMSLGGSLSSLRTSSSKGSLKPKMYTADSRPSHCPSELLFVPKTVDEEALLLLLLSEVQVNRDVVFNRTGEHISGREHSYLHATAVYDLLAIALSRRAQYSLLSEAIDRTMKFSFQELHMWRQFGYSLMSAGKYTRALLVFQECAQLDPQNIEVLLAAAKICIQHLHKIEKGIRFAKQMVDLMPDNRFLLSRGYILLGIGYGIQSSEAALHRDRQSHQKESLKYLKLAAIQDPDDYQIHFHTALQLALSRQIPEALQSVHTSLVLNPDHASSYHLLTLLLSAQKHYSEALSTIHIASKEFPQDFGLQFTKVNIEEICKGPEEALMTCKILLDKWKENQESIIPSMEVTTAHDRDRVASERRSVAQMGLSDRTDAGSVHNSVAASKVEQALSEVASSSSFLIKSGSPQIDRIQGQIWLMTAELFLKVNKPEDAKNCVNEATLTIPLSHRLLYVRGLIHEHHGNYADAIACYDGALAINPSHIKSLQNLGRLQIELGNLEMAERVLRTAVNTDPTAHQAWLTLGKVMEAQGEYENASNCLMTGLELEATSPIVPFTSIPRVIS